MDFKAVVIFIVLPIGLYLMFWMVKRQVQTWGDIPKAIKKDWSDTTPNSIKFIMDVPKTVSLLDKLRRLFL